MKNSLGVWIDKENAYIVALNNGTYDFKTISSNIEEHQIEAKRMPHAQRSGTTQIDVKEKLERHEKELIKVYLKEVIAELKDATEIVVFGPSLMKLELEKMIHADHQLLSKLRAVETTDRMTHKQIVAWVKTYYKGSARYLMVPMNK